MVGLLLLSIALDLLLTELPWRGFLLSKMQFLGRIPSVFAVAGIWSFWKTLFDPNVNAFFRNYYAPQPLLKTLVTLAMMFAIGVIVGELRLRTGSLWVGNLFLFAHALALKLCEVSTKSLEPFHSYTFWAGTFGVITLVIYAAIAWRLLFPNQRIARMQWPSET
jgi:hypothetical protein